MALYEVSNRVGVLTFLTRKYGSDQSRTMYEDRRVSEEDVRLMERYVLPKAPKSVPDLDLTNEQTKLDAVRYMVRTYGEQEGQEKWAKKEFTTHDKKMIHTMGKLFERYNRSCLERLNVNVTEFVEHELHAPNPITKPVVETCKAFKMNGEPCSAKAKLNGLCLRHSKKV
jgi:hypothetical protein